MICNLRQKLQKHKEFRKNRMPQSVFKVNDLNKIVKKGRINRNKSVKVISITWRYWNFYFNSFFKVFWHFFKKSHTRNFRVSCVKLCAHTKNFVFFVCNFVCTHEIFVFLCIVFVCVCYTRTHTRNTIFSVFKCLIIQSLVIWAWSANHSKYYLEHFRERK